MDRERNSSHESLVVSLSESAKLLDVSVDTVRRLVRKGDIPHVRIGVGLKVRRTDLDVYVNSRATRAWQPSTTLQGDSRETVPELLSPKS